MQAASSEEYGRDLEECATLIDEFETVIRELAANGERVAAVQRSCDEQLRASELGDTVGYGSYCFLRGIR